MSLWHRGPSSGKTVFVWDRRYGQRWCWIPPPPPSPTYTESLGGGHKTDNICCCGAYWKHFINTKPFIVGQLVEGILLTKIFWIWIPPSIWCCVLWAKTSYSKTCLNSHSKRRPKIGFQFWLLLNAGRQYCRMLQESILQCFRPSLI